MKHGTLELKDGETLSSALCQEECEQLPDGARVSIIWSGGNGPHECEIGHRHGGVCVVRRDHLGVVYRYVPLSYVQLPPTNCTVVRLILPGVRD